MDERKAAPAVPADIQAAADAGRGPMAIAAKAEDDNAFEVLRKMIESNQAKDLGDVNQEPNPDHSVGRVDLLLGQLSVPQQDAFGHWYRLMDDLAKRSEDDAMFVQMMLKRRYTRGAQNRKDMSPFELERLRQIGERMGIAWKTLHLQAQGKLRHPVTGASLQIHG